MGKALARPALRPVPASLFQPPNCPELDCLAGRLPAKVLLAAAARSERVGVGADQVLIASGAIGEETYIRALAEHLGIQFEPLDGLPRALCPLSDREMIEKSARGMLSIIDGPGLSTVVAPRRLAARQLSRLFRAEPRQARQWRLTTTERFNRFVLRCAGTTLARQAADDLRRMAPEFSAAP